jgi:hypothetical protein
MARLRFQLDEHLPNALARALRARGIDAVTTAEAGLLGASDAVQLQTALASGRVIVTVDSDFLTLISEGYRHVGVAYCPHGGHSVGALLAELVLIYEVFDADQMVDRVEYI